MKKAQSTGLGGARLRKNRNRFVALIQNPTQLMASNNRPPVNAPDRLNADIQPVFDWFMGQPEVKDRFSWSLRDSLDEILDGERTGRWCYQHLQKTEKTYLGTSIEINFTKEFEIPDGELLDWKVGETEVDCKFSKDFGGWEIPMEMYICADHKEQSGKFDHVALLLWMSDDTREWAAGITKIEDSSLKFKQDGTRQYNRDFKRKFSEQGMDRIHWLWGGLQSDLPENLMLRIGEPIRAKILADSGSGQKRVDALFREIPNRIITRAVVLTVGQQDDPMKRARDSRKHLAPEGYLVLGAQQADPMIAKILNLPIPLKGEFVSCRVVSCDKSDQRPKVFLTGKWWRLAESSDHYEAVPDSKTYKSSTMMLLSTGETYTV